MIQPGQLAYYNKPKVPINRSESPTTLRRPPRSESRCFGAATKYENVKGFGQLGPVELFPPYAIFNSDGLRVNKCELQARGRTQPKGGVRAPMKDWLLARSMVYGLINVRTDGTKVVMGVLKESEDSYQIEEFTP